MQYTVDLHTHTLASGHAYSTLQENIRHASEIGVKLVAVTDHGVTVQGGPNILHFYNLKVIPRVMYGVEVLRGVEANIMDYNGRLDIEQKWLKKLDVVIASYHEICIAPSTRQEHTRGLLAVMDNDDVDIIGHSGNPMYEIDIEQFVAKAKQKNKLIEINNSSLYTSRRGSESNCLAIAKEAARQRARIIMGSDAHISFDVGNLAKAYELVQKAGISEDLIMNTPERIKAYLFDKGKALDMRDT
ncbi:MAG: phosphatase [Thermoclostridium sp.]|nr:phosphatase [Thermoclostridium sp.]